MRAFPLFPAAIYLLLAVGVGVAGDKTGTEQGLQKPSFFKEYQTKTAHVKAGFVPNKLTAVLGEPLTITFTVENLGKKNLAFWFGGDYRGVGRHNSFTIGVFDGRGKKIPDPKERDGVILELGGKSWHRQIKPGAVDTEALYLPDFRTISKPGVYRVHCFYKVKPTDANGADDPEKFTVTTSFQLTILPPTKENVQRALAALMKQVRQWKQNQQSHRGDPSLEGLIERICDFAGELAVPDLIDLTVKGDREYRLAALSGLAKFTTPAAVQTARTALQDRDDRVRQAAAAALGSMKTAEAVTALLERLPLEEPEPLVAMLPSLGRTKSPRAFQPLVAYLDHKELEVRQAAAKALGELGGEKALEVLTRCATDADLYRRHAVVGALVHYYQLPVRAEWVLPLIRSGKQFPLREQNLKLAIMMLGQYGGMGKEPALIRCMDFKDPAGALNHWILSQYHLGKVPDWHEHPKTAQQLESNWQTLRGLKHWLVAIAPVVETPPPSTRPHPPKTLPKSSPKVAQLIAQLGSKKFTERAAASKALVALGDDDAVDALLWIVQTPTDLETRRRAEKLVLSIEQTWENRRLSQYNEAVTGVAWCADGKRVVWCGKGSQAGLWDTQAGNSVREFPPGTDTRQAIAVSPDGQHALCGEGETAILWDLNIGKVVHTLGSHAGAVVSVAISADSKRALTGGEDARMYLWDLTSGKELRRFLGHGDSVRSVAFAPKDGRALSASLDGTIRLWDMASGQELACLRGHRDAVWAAAFLPDSKHLLSAGCDRTVRLWELQTGREVRRFLGHTDSIYSLAVTANGQRAISGGHDGTARLWDLGTGKELQRLRLPFGWVEAVALSPDGRRVMVGGTAKTLRLWELAE